jgi:hypothetical protein
LVSIPERLLFPCRSSGRAKWICLQPKTRAERDREKVEVEDRGECSKSAREPHFDERFEPHFYGLWNNAKDTCVGFFDGVGFLFLILLIRNPDPLNY